MKRGRQRRTDTVTRAYTCLTCGKATWLGRAQAKRAIKQNHPGADLRPYRSCDDKGFHIGDLAPAVVAGHKDRAEFYGGQW